MSSPHRATIAGCGALALWAFLAPLARLAQPLPPPLLTALGFAAGGGLGLVVLVARGRLRVQRQPPLAWVHGVGGLAGFHALYFAALALAPPVEANLLNYTWPLLIVLLAAHLALEPAVWPGGRQWLAVLLLGLGPMGAAFFLWDLGMKRGDPRLLGTLGYGTPVASTLLLVALGEGALT